MSAPDAPLFAKGAPDRVPPPGDAAPGGSRVPSDSEREIGRAILGALDAYWSTRDDTPAGIAADKLIVKTLTPFGAWAATLSIEKHRAAAPRHHREPDCAALAEMAKEIRQQAAGSRQREFGQGTWKPPADRPEDLARSERMREWAAGLSDEQHERLRAKGTTRLFSRWRERDLRATAAGRAMLAEIAQRTEPELLPIGLREDIDTRGSRQQATGSRRSA